MAVKYTIPYRSIDDTQWRVDILNDAYTDDPITVRGFGDNACTIEYDGGVDDPFDNPLVTSKAIIQLINHGEVDVDELQEANERDFIVEVYRNNSLKWKGYLITDNIQQPYLSTPYVMQLSAIDGLNMLEGITFSINNLPAPPGGAIRCPLNWLRLVLFREQNLGLPLPIRWYVGLENVATEDDPMAGLITWSPYGEGIQAGEFIDGTGQVNTIYQNCRYILEGLVKCMKGARIFQADGAWNVFPPIDIIGGSFTYNECDATLGLPIITQHTVDINRMVVGSKEPGGDYYFIREDSLLTVKPPLSRVDVEYDADRRENILPNGGMDLWSTGSLLHWGFSDRTGDVPSIEQFESLTGQPGQAVQLTNDGSATEEAEFTFVGGLPIDANLLFKRMTFGFTIMPTEFGFTYDGNEIIDWSNNPLKLSIIYTLPIEGGTRDYYLNEFGYWQWQGRGLDLGVLFVNVETTYLGSNVNRQEIIFEGSPNVGDVLQVGIRNNPGGGYQWFSFTVTLTEEGNLELALDGLLAAITNTRIAGEQVNMDNPGRGRIRFQDLINYGTPSGNTYKSGSTQEYQYIFPSVDNLAINDVASVVFQGKGGNNEILIPDPGLLDGQQDPAVGKMYVRFYVKPGQRYVLDDIWMRVEDNNDVYRASVASRGSSQTITLGISSSFSGFLVSNLMRSYHESNTDFLWTDGTTVASLTEHYTRAVMRWRYKSSKIFNGTINTRTKDWSFLEIYAFSGMEGRKFLPLNAKYNTETCEVNLVAMEGRNDGTGITVQHYASNNMPLSNYGG